MGVLVLGGADLWSGGGGPAAEIRAGTTAAVGDLHASAAGTLEGIGQPDAGLLVDQLRGAVRWRPNGVVTPLATVSASGSIAGPWFTGVATAGVDLRVRAVRASAVVGGGLRQGGASVGPEGLGAVTLGLPIGPVRSWTGASVRILGGELPPLALDASQWLSLGSRLRLELGAVASAVPRADAPAVAGLPAPGTVVLQGIAAGTLSLTDRWSVRLELGPEGAWGTYPYRRVRALAGIRADLGAGSPESPIPTPRGTRFELRASDADEVELLGAFSDWRPVPMIRDGRRWTAEVDVPAGSWEFVYRVDGETVVPPAADRYVPDGFGGTNGVVVVP